MAYIIYIRARKKGRKQRGKGMEGGQGTAMIYRFCFHVISCATFVPRFAPRFGSLCQQVTGGLRHHLRHKTDTT